jgi:hypothetical protein
MKLYEEMVAEFASYNKSEFLVESIRSNLAKLMSIFDRKYFEDNAKFKEIRERYHRHKDACDRYLTQSDYRIGPSVSYNTQYKKPSLGINAYKYKTLKNSYYNCKTDTDKIYYSDLLKLLKTSSEEMCRDKKNHAKCMAAIHRTISSIESNLNKINFVSKYISNDDK